MTQIELEAYFENKELPKNVKLDQASTITDTSIFIETNLLRLKLWKGEIGKCPSYIHLMELVKVVDSK